MYKSNQILDVIMVAFMFDEIRYELNGMEIETAAETLE